MKQGKFSPVLTGIAKITGVLPALLFFCPKVILKDPAVQGRRLPKPCILVSNHTSLMDFVLYLLVFFGRNIRFLMGEVLFRKNAFLSRLLFWLGGIYVDRSATDFGFIAHSLAVLDAGGTVGVFPQGRLPVGHVTFPFMPGAVMIALRTSAPIVPVYTEGGYRLFHRARVVIGTPINVRDWCREETPSAEEIARLTARLQEETMGLKELCNG